MGGLSGLLHNSANSLGVFERAFETIENNITNANTPGYAKQVQSLDPLPFDPGQGLPGGVMAGPLLSSRSEYLEQSIRNQQSAIFQRFQVRLARIALLALYRRLAAFTCMLAAFAKTRKK